MSGEELAYGNELILVVDDEEAVREPLAEMLRFLGFRVQSRASGEEALKELEAKEYTFLLTDMKMPGMDGMELIEQAKKAHPELTVIAMTGYSKGYRYIDVINAGATDFINKPFGVEELEAKIRRAASERDIRRELARLSITDSLTGLYNQRHFYSRLKEEITRATRQHHGLALILLDLDDFKIYNDTHGHLAGDELLQKLGTIINASIREGVDSGYRYGGDEFAVILIDADLQVAAEIARRIEGTFHKESGMSASTGFATFQKGMSAEDLVAEADRNLYSRKSCRKNDTAGHTQNV
ncbi:MAG: diguanylate cyclase [Deltaproteobacteria bacterium]|nr:diguanylate cyclase [Deltaproteobacteria bacterium]MBW1924587.1 diguanylate cyclase [Deltaproteobacteria bacterium]MBW1951165.1 diguanylate cyclase [Deltaproteobacteria bacterium]MBW2009164.1 diguanylate cyclase [Deltaproteobacteria bacterium]MBW2104124.1 diguanylate cyclase [Deltaproteobacteria bacterium]